MASTPSDVQPLVPGTAPQLPPELIQQVLADMPQRDLRVFARASHACYAHALQAGLRIHVHVSWMNVRDRGFGDSLPKLDMVLDHAAGRPDLNIAITARMLPHENDTPAYRKAMLALVPSIRRALPYLVALKASFADYAAFCADPAPKLRELAIYHAGTEGPVLVPSNLFAGVAPMLRKVSLSPKTTEPMSAWQPIAAFGGVTHLRLTTQTIPHHLPLARAFAALRVLVIDALRASGTQNVDLRGLSLRHFVLLGDMELLTAASAASLRDVPVVELYAPSVPEAFWPTQRDYDELCAVAARYGRRKTPSISVGTRNGGTWRRTVLAGAVADMPLLAAKLVSLTVEESLAMAFVEAPVALAALRELFLDLSKPRIRAFTLDRLFEASPRVRCPALARVVLLVVPGAPGPVMVAPQAVARLGRALGLGSARPALVLEGCWWNRLRPLDPTQLRQLFSDVDAAETTAVGVPEYYRSCRCSGYFDARGWD